VLTVRKRGTDGDVEPVLICRVCGKRLRLQEAWLDFCPVSPSTPQSEGQWLHRGCLDGQAKALFGTSRVVLWQARWVLEKLMRMTE
jgi:hypothetical protein